MHAPHDDAEHVDLPLPLLPITKSDAPQLISISPLSSTNKIDGSGPPDPSRAKPPPPLPVIYSRYFENKGQS